jgi:uncharacterized protein (DUF1778 family)
MRSTAAAEKKTARVAVRISRDQRETLEKAAAIEGCSLADFIIEQALLGGERLMQQHRSIRLNLEQSQRLAQSFLSPAGPPPKALKKADRAYKSKVLQS